MKFRTEIVPIFDASLKLEPQHKVLLMGSCFSEEIGKKIYVSGWDATINPLGIHFHPVVMAKLLIASLEDTFPEEFLIERDGVFYSLLFHSKFHGNSREELLEKIHHAWKNLSEVLRAADFVFFTWGTAWYYYYLPFEVPVANCHKLPQQHFERKLSDPSDIVLWYSRIEDKIRKINAKAKFFLTVSPVRYIRHGILENTLSKSILIYAAHELCVRTGWKYFPAYELVSEDLKDYRFYKSDLMHPNEMAVDYVWEKLTHSLVSEDGKRMQKEVNDYYNMLAHRSSVVSEKNVYRIFLENLARKRTELLEKYAWLQNRNEFQEKIIQIQINE